MKKVVTVILSLVLVFSFTMVASAEEIENVDSFVYQGEDYYKAQTDNPAADLQPGEQIDIKLSDNSSFTAGVYNLTVVSCGNRETIIVKSNDTEVGTISRVGTGFGMDQMTNDVMEKQIELTPSDILSTASEAGEYYGWVDYILLEKVVEASGTSQVTDTEATADTEEASMPKTGENTPTYLLLIISLLAGGMIISRKCEIRNR